MSQPRRQFVRPENKNRDARLFLIASEGKETERIYIEAVKEIFQSPRIHIDFIPSKDPTKSSPSHTLRSLDNLKKEYSLTKTDELWLLIDRDRWTGKELKDVAQKCIQKIFYLAVSNPCFELWLLLHLKSLSEYSEEEKEMIFENSKEGSRTFLEKELSLLLNGYSKASPKIFDLAEKYRIAVRNAIEIDTDPGTRWPESVGTRVYKLMLSIEEFIKKS